MSFVCSDSCEICTTKKKCSRNAQANYLFQTQLMQSVVGSKVILWNFQCVKCLDKHAEHWYKMMEEKAGVERQNYKEGFERMSVPAA